MSAQTASIIVALGAVFFALAVTLWAIRLTRGVREANLGWRRRAEALEDKINHADSLFAAHPGLVMVWPDAVNCPDGQWGIPRIYGSQVALGSMLKFAQSRNRADPASAILEGLADYEARDSAGNETTLRERLTQLHTRGEPFSLTIIGPNGHFLEVDGRAAGVQIALWLTDSTIKGLEESSARGRLEELRHSVAKDPIAFIDMLSKAPQPIWRLSSGMKLDWANGAYLRAVEATDLDDAIARQLTLDPKADALAKTVLEKRQTQSQIITAVTHGKSSSYAVNAFAISGGVACIAYDVTQAQQIRKQMDLQARAHDETLNHLADSVVIFSPEQKLMFHNTAFMKLFGLDENWLAEHPSHGQWLDFLRARRRIPEQAKYAEWKEAELAHYNEQPNAENPDELWHLPDGRILRLARLHHPLGGLLFIFEDMTDQIDLKAQFTTLINVQKATLDKLTEAVAVFGSDGRMRLHNASFESLWHLGDKDAAEGEPFDVIANKCRTLFPGAQYWDEMKARITDPGGEMRRHMTGEINRTDGSVLTWLSHPLPDGASVVAWSDVTDSKRVEKSLKDRAEAIQAAADLKSHFVEHVSYQVRAPLTTISGYADLLESGYAGPLNDKLKGPVDAIHAASSQLATMLENILDVAAVEAGTLALNLNDVDPYNIIEGVVTLVQSRAEQSQVKIKMNCDQQIEKLRADGQRLKQVLYNLMLNAMTYTEAGCTIEVGAKAEEDMVQFWVCDDGVGIDEEKRAQVFEEFESGKGGGAGLGLALVSSFIDLHGGLVRLESEKGKGTKVTCLLPRLARTKNAPPELALQGTSEKV